MMRQICIFTLSFAFVVATGCTTHIGANSGKVKEFNSEIEELKAKMNAPASERVRISDIPMAGEPVKIPKHQWLKNIRLTLPVAKDSAGITGRALAEMLRSKGVNVMSSLPLESYTYTGFGVSNVDGETAMRLLFTPMGLDYVINDEGQFVAVVPMRSRTWYLKLGARKTSYKNGTISGNVGSSSGSSGSSGTSSGGSGSGLGGSGGTNSNLVGGVSTGVDTGSGKIEIEGKFWENLDKQLSSMLKQCIPTTSSVAPVSVGSSLPPLPPELAGSMGGAMPPSMNLMTPNAQAPAAGSSSSQELCAEQTIGNYSTNPDTGAITVQAPHWVMSQVDELIKRVKNDNGAVMVYEGMLIMVSTTRDKSEGLDLQAFASFAGGKYGMVVNNNALGGVTVSPPSTGNPPAVTPGDQGVIGNTFLGLQKLTGNPAQIFLAYLEANGNFTVKQKPRLVTTNGVPGEFAQYETQYYNQIVQNTSSGSSGGALVGTTNQLVPFKTGALLRIVPTYDAEEQTVRSPITFTQSIQTGVYQSVQFITGSDGKTEQIPSPIPKIRDSNFSGEVLMRDGDMIILGGQVSESNESSGSGIPGYNAEGNFLSGLMGKKTHKDAVSTYYLALTLRINK